MIKSLWFGCKFIGFASSIHLRFRNILGGMVLAIHILQDIGWLAKRLYLLIGRPVTASLVSEIEKARVLKRLSKKGILF